MPHRHVARRRQSLALLLFVALIALVSCSSDDEQPQTKVTEPSTEPSTETEVTGGPDAGGTTLPAAERPAGPSADVSEELTGGAGVFLGAASAGADLADIGWEEHEFVAAGTATSYVSDGELPTDGRFELSEGDQADYRTRIVVRRPSEPADFNGTVVVEWLNVSGGIDANPDYALLADDLHRQGTAWVGVSAQLIGVEGGEVAVAVDIGTGVAGEGLKVIDPERYGTLEHPGDAYAYDMFTQVARALRTEADTEGDSGPLGDLDVERLLAVGESQSGFTLTTYVNGVHPLANQFDGFFIHSRGGASLPLGAPDEALSIVDAIGGPPITIRTDQAVPVLMLETETDLVSVIGYYPARQPDSDTVRLWEVAGTAHADAFLVGPVAETLDCGVAINDGPQRFAVRAAVRSLDAWVRTGERPPESPRLEIDDTSGTPTVVRDPDGNALGGIRLPQVEAPIATLSGEPGSAGGVICLLLGSTTPFASDRLAELYPSESSYTTAYEDATDAAIEAGFALDEDREQMMADADPSAIPG